MSKFPSEPSKTGSEQRGSWPSVAQLLSPEPDLFSLRALLADLTDPFSLWGNFSDVQSRSLQDGMGTHLASNSWETLGFPHTPTLQRQRVSPEEALSFPAVSCVWTQN